MRPAAKPRRSGLGRLPSRRQIVRSMRRELRIRSVPTTTRPPWPAIPSTRTPEWSRPGVFLPTRTSRGRAEPRSKTRTEWLIESMYELSQSKTIRLPERVGHPSPRHPATTRRSSVPLSSDHSKSGGSVRKPSNSSDGGAMTTRLPSAETTPTGWGTRSSLAPFGSGSIAGRGGCSVACSLAIHPIGRFDPPSG